MSDQNAGGLIVRHAEPVMGTIVSFDVRPQGLPFADARRALRSACACLHDADRIFSLHAADSPLQQVRDRRLALRLAPGEISEVLDLCETARLLSDGAFDPWALSGGLDPTGLVKGWAAERAAAVLRDAGIGAAMVNAAGDIAAFGRPAPQRRWRIGIRTPESADRLICIAETDCAIATSGQYERAHHIVDPATGRPACGARSATVSGPSLAIADALATGLVVTGTAGLRGVLRAGYDALIVDPAGSVISSPSFPVAGRTMTRAPSSSAACSCASPGT